jgi:fatty-acyl-CoA synthase
MLKAAEVAYILRHSEARLLCVDAELAAVGMHACDLDTAVEQVIELPSEDAAYSAYGLRRFDELLLEPLPERDFDGHELAQIVYTSGTESQPKGAMHTHEAVIWEYVSCLVDAEIAHEDRILHAMPLYHCAQLDIFLGPGVYVGATHVITAYPTPDNLLALIEHHGITSFFAPPTVWISLLRSPLFDRHDLSSLRKGYYGASIMPVEVLRELQRRLPDVRLWNLYGQTEIAPVATVLKPEEQLRKPGSAGRAALNVETRVVNDDGVDVAVGEVGEIVHRSPQLLSGYFRDDERSNAAFAGGWFHSGDLATIDSEGYISVVDRKKDVIKSGGENVASREVEEVLYCLPTISEAAVIGLPDDRWVEAVTAIVVLREGQSLTESEVIAHCAGKLARFKVPKRVIFTDSLPKNPSGKLLKRELRHRFGG